MRRLLIALLPLLFALTGCGGGGSSAPPPPPSVVTIALEANKLLDKKLANGVRLIGDPGLVATNGEATVTCRTDDWGCKQINRKVISLRMLAEFKSNVPLVPGKGFTVTFDCPSEDVSRPLGIQLNDDDSASSMKVSKNGDRITVFTTVPSLKSSAELFLLRVGLAMVPYSPPYQPKATKLMRLQGNGPDNAFPSGAIVALYVHGFIGNPSDFVLAAARFATEHGIQYDATYAFTYPSVIDIAENGRTLRQLLKSQPPDTKCYIFAHSMGGAVTRFALEQMDEPSESPENRASHHVAGAFFFGSPFTGTALGEAGLKFMLESEQINNTATSCEAWEEIGALGSMATTSVKQLMPNSSFLQLLDRPTNNLNDVPYVAVAGFYDVIAGETSAHHLPNNATLGRRQTDVMFKCGHLAYFVADRIADLVQLVKDEKSIDSLSSTTQLPNGNRASNNGWAVSTSLRNTSNSRTLTVTEMIMKYSCRDGTQFTRQWYDANVCGFLPDTRKGCEVNIPPSGTFVLNGRVAFNYTDPLYTNAPYNDRAKTADVYAHGHDDLGRPFSAHEQFKLLDVDGSGPSTPRSTTSPTLARGGPFMRL
jgi:pimeloyl-ACP methyl ester carboxylesterase